MTRLAWPIRIMNGKLAEKIEKLTPNLVDQEKRIDALEAITAN